MQLEPHSNPGIWKLVPSPRTYQLGSVFKSRILVHNSGRKPVFFVMPSWQQSSTHAAHDDKGNPIKVTATEWTTMASMKMYRLEPGAYLETSAPGIGVGARTDKEDWANLRPGAWVHAKEGDEVRLTPGNVEVRVSPFVVGRHHGNGFQNPKDAAELWDTVVAERVKRELPIPTKAADREQLLRRVVRDLYGVDPTQSEIDAFIADQSPGALHPVTGETMLRERVTHNRTMSAFTGTLPPGEMTFRVLAADPQAGNRTRIASEPGYYILGDNQRLHVEQSRRGDLRVNKATIRFFSPNPKTTPAAEPVVVPLPDGVNTYEILWDRGAGVLWVTQEGLTRKFDFTDPADVKETRVEPGSSPDVPGFRDWVKDLPEIPPLPGLPDDPTPDGPEPTGTKLDPGMEANLKWGATVNGLRAAISFRRPGDKVNNLYVVVQNVSDAAIRLDDAAAANKNTVWIRITGAIQTAMSGKDARSVDVMLQPREVAFVRVLSPEATAPDGRTISAIIADSALKDPNWTMTVELDVAQATAGSWQGNLLTADTSGVEASRTTVEPPAKPVEKPVAKQPQSGAQLEPGREDNLQWGEPVNGLRAALIRPPALGSPESIQTKDFQMVIQNVSPTPVRLVADATAPNPRHLTLSSRKHGWMQAQGRAEEPSGVDVLLQPGEVIVLDMLRSGGVQGSSISRNLDTVFTGDMTIEQAPPGAWVGTLVTAEMQAAFLAHGLLPRHKDARQLFMLWNQGARWDRTVPGGVIGVLAASIKQFTDSNPTWKTTPQLLELLPRLDTNRDWDGHEALALLDEIAAIQASPIQAVLEGEVERTVRSGAPLPKELLNAPWGMAQANGVRVAWLLDPQQPEHSLGSTLRSRILIHNTGKSDVVFRTASWHQSAMHKAHNGGGAAVQVSTIRSLTRTQDVPFRLKPGEFVEVPAADIGVGTRPAQQQGRRFVGAWVNAKAGDDVTFIPAPVVLDGRIRIATTEDADAWWKALVIERVNREKPVPADDEIRRRMIYKVSHDLFGGSPSDEDVAAFLADRTPAALDTLGERLANHARVTPFSGALQSGSTTFRVTAAAADVAKQEPPDQKTGTDDDSNPVPKAAPATDAVPSAAKSATDEEAADEEAIAEPATEKPEGSRKGPVRSANRSGVFSLTKGRKLYVCRPTVVNPWLAVLWEKKAPWPESRIRIYPKVSEQNRRNWAVVWEPTADELWFVDDTAVTHVDITNPAEVLTTQQDFDKPAVLIFKFPDHVRAEFQRLGFEIPRSKQSEDNHVTDGQVMLTGETMKTWTIEGTVTGADGKPMVDVPIRLRTAYHPTINVEGDEKDVVAPWDGAIVEINVQGGQRVAGSAQSEPDARRTRGFACRHPERVGRSDPC
ncbi:MAG: DUF1549 domain-containing protein [Planctomycetota bacterium]|nr:DUF1549 domain-containing protein [Planctomycetota bacterium]